MNSKKNVFVAAALILITLPLLTGCPPEQIDTLDGMAAQKAGTMLKLISAAARFF